MYRGTAPVKATVELELNRALHKNRRTRNDNLQRKDKKTTVRGTNGGAKKASATVTRIDSANGITNSGKIFANGASRVLIQSSFEMSSPISRKSG